MSLTLWGYLKLAFKLSHGSALKIFGEAHQYSRQNNSFPYSHFQLYCVPSGARVGLRYKWVSSDIDKYETDK